MTLRRCVPMLMIAAFGLAALPLAAQYNISRWTSIAQLAEGYVDRSNLDLHLEFPIFDRATGSKAQVNAVLVYDSQFWQVNNGTWSPEAGGGWWLRASLGRKRQAKPI